jgi:Transposase IS116/IS110/IS902 family
VAQEGEREVRVGSNAIDTGVGGLGGLVDAVGAQVGQFGAFNVAPQALETEVAELDRILEPLVAQTAPALVARPGIGTECASALLVAAGDNPERLRNEATFAHLCGVAPLDASSGKHERHRLNRGGDRQAKSALWRIVITRMVYDPRTRHYIERRMKEGLTKKEAFRCLKRYIAREVYNCLPANHLALEYAARMPNAVYGSVEVRPLWG